ncbi:MAG: M16 family metallopeptidase [Caulobacterales bacterium]|uniref:M16 family metallopeptidase n=1 Tax=Glycocaulis sp. TaxID=1969725 RepID=UPI003FA15F1C
MKIVHTGKSLLVSLVLLSLAACGNDPAPAEPEAPAEAAAPSIETEFAHLSSGIPADPGMRFGEFENGMRYVIMPNSTPSGTASLRLVFNMGSLAEAEHQRGLAHFIEHMAFNGTTNVPEGEMIPLLERYGLAFGPDTNAFTGQELVGYQLDLPSVEEQILKTGLFLMRETASEMVMDAEAIDAERGVIRGEMRFRDTPIQRFLMSYYGFLYPDTIVPERSPIGTLDVINNAPREAFVEYYEDFYVPQRALLVVTGDVDADAVEAMIRDGFEIELPGLEVSSVEGFASWEAPADAPADPDIGSVTALDAPRFGYFHDPEVFTLITYDVVVPGAPQADSAQARLESTLRQLGNGIVQRRLQSQINSGLSPLVQANLSYSNDFDLAHRAGVFAVSSPERWREGLSVIEQEIRRAMEYGFSQAELDEQLANLRTNVRNAVNGAGTRRTPQLADGIWQGWLNGSTLNHPSWQAEWLESIEGELTLENVEAAFRGIWAAAPVQIYVGVNEEIENGEAAVQEAWEASRGAPVDPLDETGATEFAYSDFGPAGEVVSREHVEDLDFHQIVFANGVRLNVKPTEFEDNIIRIRAEFGAGDLTPQPTPAAGTILGAVFGGGGLEAHDRDELQRLFAGRSVGYGLGVGADSFQFSSATTPEDFELQMQVLTAFMVAPGWREDGLNQFRSIAEEVRRGQNAQAVQVAVNRVSRMLRSGDERWGFPLREEIAAFTMDHARAMVGEALESAPLEVTIVGDVTVDEAIAVTASTFGALPERAEEWPTYDDARQLTFPEGREDPAVVNFNGQPDSGMANIYWPVGDAFDARRSRALDLMAEIYSLKATERFREQEGATYSPIVSSQASIIFPDYGFLWVGLDVDRSEVDRMYEIADELAAAMASGDISEDELQRARQPVLERLSQSMESNAMWLGQLSRSQTYPERLDRLRTAQEDYNAVTVEEITALAAEYLQPERAYRVSILPQDGAPATE